MPIHELVCDDQQKREMCTEGELTDYKLMCFNGKVKCSFVCSERFSGSGLKVTFFDTDWNIMPFERHYPQSKNPLKNQKAITQWLDLQRNWQGISHLLVLIFMRYRGKSILEK